MLAHITTFQFPEPPSERHDPFVLVAAALLTWNVTADAELTAAVVAGVEALLLSRRRHSDCPSHREDH
jgi:hypothetical protein